MMVSEPGLLQSFPIAVAKKQALTRSAERGKGEAKELFSSRRCLQTIEEKLYHGGQDHSHTGMCIPAPERGFLKRNQLGLRASFQNCQYELSSILNAGHGYENDAGNEFGVWRHVDGI